MLENARLLKREDSDLIFPGESGDVMSHATLPKMCQRINLPGTPHGFRSSFATWCADKGVPQEVTEAALAHTPDAVVKAYTRTDYPEQRARLMQAWSDYIEGTLPDDWTWMSPEVDAIIEAERKRAEEAEKRAEKSERRLMLVQAELVEMKNQNVEMLSLLRELRSDMKGAAWRQIRRLQHDSGKSVAAKSP